MLIRHDTAILHMEYIMIIDTHAHYDLKEFDEDRDELLSTMMDHGVSHIMNSSSDVASWQKTLQLSEYYPNVFSTIGVHPDSITELGEEEFLRMQDLLQHPKVVAVGEIGLDYYWDVADRNLQKEYFIRQMNLAREFAKPIIIHSREAAQDTMEILRSHGKGLTGSLHCFSYSVEHAKEYVKMGYYIGVGGVVTFKNGRKLKEVVEAIPLTSMLLETDCPYLAPVPFRGKRNSSTLLTYVVDAIAELKGVTAQEVIEVTSSNARVLFQLP